MLKIIAMDLKEKANIDQEIRFRSRMGENVWN